MNQRFQGFSLGFRMLASGVRVSKLGGGRGRGGGGADDP